MFHIDVKTPKHEDKRLILMEIMNKTFYNIRNQLAELHDGFRLGMEWYKQEMDKLRNENLQLKNTIQSKDKEIEELKKKIDDKSSK